MVRLPGGRGDLEGANAESLYGEQVRARQIEDQVREWQEPKWEDYPVPANTIRLLGLGADPSWTDAWGANGAIYLLTFSAAAAEEVHFAVQFPHGWQEGTNLRPHVHWAPSGTNTGNVLWKLEYSWANINEAFPNPVTISALDAGAGVARTHQIAAFDEIDGSDKTMSSMICCRLYRDGGDADDTLTNAAYLLEFDFHILKDSQGSVDEYNKQGAIKTRLRGLV